MKEPIAFIYYRILPDKLMSELGKYPTLSYTKDGITRNLGHACPRLTILSEIEDRAELLRNQKTILALLKALKDSGQIISWSAVNK